jgi:hypothetical protein
MDSLSPRASGLFSSIRPSRLAMGLVIGLAVVSLMPAQSASAREIARHQGAVKAFWPAPDDDVVLPTRVAVAIERTQNAVDRSTSRIDDGRYKKARRSLKAVVVDFGRAHRAGMAQMNAPVDPEAETTPGPDSVLAVLTLEQAAITNLAGLFDGITGHPRVVSRISGALAAANTNRNLMLNAVIALDPEEAGADYADGMADTVDGYADEVANLTEALHDDQLSAASRAALKSALAKSRATAAKVNTAFGGGE